MYNRIIILQKFIYILKGRCKSVHYKQVEQLVNLVDHKHIEWIWVPLPTQSFVILLFSIGIGLFKIS